MTYVQASLQRCCCRLRISVLALAATVLAGTLAQADPLSFRTRDWLEGAGSTAVVAAIRYAPGSERHVLDAFGRGQHVLYPELSTLIALVPAENLLEAGPAITRIEVLDRSMVSRIQLILEATRRILALQGTMYSFGALNISLGAPKALLGSERSGEHTVRDALGRVVQSGIPVVMSIGNNGPVEGSVNPWALTPGVIMAAATDSAGRTLWPSSSRLRPEDAAGRNIFAAHGYLSVGAWAAGSSKTPAMLEAERQVDLTSLVGAGNEHLYRVDSGTSYAAADITRTICMIHQAMMGLQLMASGTEALTAILPPFVRAYMDSGIDETHPAFRKRLVNRTPIYGGQQFSLTPERRARLSRLAFAGIVLDMRYQSAPVLALLKRAARPVPDTNAQETGFGFVSLDLVASTIAALRPADLAALFSDSADPRFADWTRIASEDSDPLFTGQEIEQLRTYCSGYDLVLMLKIP